MPERRVKLVYPSQLVDQPILYQLIQRFGVVTTIVQADVTETAGWLLIEMRGDEAIIDQALAWLREIGIEVQEKTA